MTPKRHARSRMSVPRRMPTPSVQHRAAADALRPAFRESTHTSAQTKHADDVCWAIMSPLGIRQRCRFYGCRKQVFAKFSNVSETAMTNKLDRFVAAYGAGRSVMPKAALLYLRRARTPSAGIDGIRFLSMRSLTTYTHHSDGCTHGNRRIRRDGNRHGHTKRWAVNSDRTSNGEALENEALAMV